MRSDPPSRILIADDQADVIEALRLLLKPEGFVIDTAASPPQLLPRPRAQGLRRGPDGSQLHARHHVG
jgi:CheY-like chemotaxis protein